MTKKSTLFVATRFDEEMLREWVAAGWVSIEESEIGQISGDIKVADVVKNDLVDVANSFDAAKVKADAEGFALSDDYKKVDAEAIKAAL